MQKPPLGITPRWLYDEMRATEIAEGMARYIAARKEIPEEWTKEYNELIARNKDSE